MLQKPRISVKDHLLALNTSREEQFQKSFTWIVQELMLSHKTKEICWRMNKFLELMRINK